MSRLWVDTHQPKRLYQLDYHNALSATLQNLAEAKNMTHMVFYGPAGAGKRTRVYALLRELFGPEVDNTKLETVDFENSSGGKKEIIMVTSKFHVEINPSDVQRNDRYAIRTVVQRMSRSKPLSMRAFFRKPPAGGEKKPPAADFRVLVIADADKLTTEAQQALRRMMEVHVHNCRMILMCSNTSRVLEAVRSRCLCVRVGAPTTSEVAKILAKVADKEGLESPPELLQRIATTTKWNLRDALLTFERCKNDRYPFTADQPVHLADWRAFVRRLARQIAAAQTPASLKDARAALYQLLTNCIPGETILLELTRELLACKDSARTLTVKNAVVFDQRLRAGNKEIYHLEAFVARFMLDVKRARSQKQHP